MSTEEAQNMETNTTVTPLEINISPIIENNELKVTSWVITINKDMNDSKILEKICEPIMEAHSKERIAYWEHQTKKIEAKTKILTTVVGLLCFVAIVIFGFIWPIFNQKNNGQTQQQIENSKKALTQDNNDSSNIFVNNVILECQTPKIVTKTTKKQTIPSDLNITKDPCKEQK